MAVDSIARKNTRRVASRTKERNRTHERETKVETEVIATTARRFFFDLADIFDLELLPTVDLYDAILVHVLEDVRCVHEDPDGARGRHEEENVELQPIDHHRHVLPILSRLKHTYNMRTCVNDERKFRKSCTTRVAVLCTCMYKSSFLKCSAMNSTASVALLASGLSSTESELSDPLLSARPSPPAALELLVVW